MWNTLIEETLEMNKIFLKLNIFTDLNFLKPYISYTVFFSYFLDFYPLQLILLVNKSTKVFQHLCYIIYSCAPGYGVPHVRLEMKYLCIANCKRRRNEGANGLKDAKGGEGFAC